MEEYNKTPSLYGLSCQAVFCQTAHQLLSITSQWIIAGKIQSLLLDMCVCTHIHMDENVIPIVITINLIEADKAHQSKCRSFRVSNLAFNIVSLLLNCGIPFLNECMYTCLIEAY